MKLLAFLLFISSFCYSQEIITVTSTTGQRLSDVSVFQLAASNSLLGITDSLGTVKLTLNENGKYLFHLLGYIDRTFSASELKKSLIVKIESSVYQLNEVVVGKLKTKLIKIVNKPGKLALGEINTAKITFERVTPLKIDKAGFLSKFALYAYRNFAGAVRTFRFIILANNDGSPGKSLINYSIIGNLKKGKMIFNLDSLAIFLEQGNYFIGYETQNSGGPSNTVKKGDTKNGAWLNFPTVFIRGKSLASPKTFIRSNFKDWHLTGTGYSSTEGQVEKKYFDFGYELEMRIPVAN